MTNETAITTIEVQGTSIEHYGNRDVVRELVDRLMAFHPAAKDVGEPGMRHAAQLAILMGASPIPGMNEIHIWVEEKSGKKTVRVEPGINYWRRHGEQKGGVRWAVRQRPMTSSEREMYGIADHELAAICRGMRVDEYQACRREGMSFSEADNACAIVGLGTVKKTDYAKNGRPLIWTAIKRCETDFYKRAFPFIPGETLHAGAGLKLAEGGGYVSDFQDPHWDIVRDKPESPVASIDRLRDGVTIVTEAGPDPSEATADAPTENEQPEPTENVPDLTVEEAVARDFLEDIAEPILGNVARAAVISDTGYRDAKHATNALCKNAKIALAVKDDKMKCEPGQRISSKGALELLDWLMVREHESGNGKPAADEQQEMAAAIAEGE